MTDWKVYAVHIVRKMLRMRKFGAVHTIEETHLKHGTKINNKQDKKAFDEALRYLVNKDIILFKSKDYATADRAYFLNASRSAEISRIVETGRLLQ